MLQALQQVWQETVSEVESKIDPFDLNVFMPYIDDNVKRSVYRTYVSYTNYYITDY